MTSSPTLSFLSLAQRLGLNADQFKTALQQAVHGLYVALPCIIQSFDSSAMTVSVLPAIMEKMYKNVGGVPTPTDTPWDKPISRQIPVVCLNGGGAGGGGTGCILTMPIQAGDECLVIFCDFCIDSWWQSGGTGNVQLDKRRHDLSDGIAIVGPFSQPNAIDDYNEDSAELRTLDGTVKLTLGEDGITLTGPVTLDGATTINGDIGFFDATPASKPTVTGSRAGNVALQNLLLALEGMGLLVDGTS
jgi:hypothetical protein